MNGCKKEAVPMPIPSELADRLPRALLKAIRATRLDVIEEIRIHTGRFCTLSVGGKNVRTGFLPNEQQMRELLIALCNGSPYAFSETMRNGYISLQGGVRVGICGTAVVENDTVVGVNNISGVIIRIPHRVHTDPSPILDLLKIRPISGGILIFAPPTVGKTTLLRAVAVEASEPSLGRRTVVVDSRSEMKYTLDGEHLLLDVLEGYPKELGIEIAVRTMGAELVICDEIGTPKEAQAILQAAICGVPLIASIHASEIGELLRRPFMLELHRARVFHTYVRLSRLENRFSYRFYSWEEAEGLCSTC